jgi:uncharacterized membrane protein
MQEEGYVHRKQKVNISGPERLISVILGARLLVNGKGGLFRGMSAGYLLYRGLTGRCGLYAAMGKEDLPDPDRNINIRTTIKVDQPRAKVYAAWKRLENLPLFMKHIENVETDDADLSRWTAKLPGMPGSITWEAKVINDVHGEVLGWSSLPGSDIENAGKVEFRDAPDGGTELHVNITYRAPLGDAGTAIASLLTPVFRKMVRTDVENFKLFIQGEHVHPLKPQTEVM